MDWSGPFYVANQATLDLWQLGFMAPYRGGVGMPWEVIAPPKDSSSATYAVWSAGLARYTRDPSLRVNSLSNPCC